MAAAGQGRRKLSEMREKYGVYKILVGTEMIEVPDLPVSVLKGWYESGILRVTQALSEETERRRRAEVVVRLHNLIRSRRQAKEANPKGRVTGRPVVYGMRQDIAEVKNLMEASESCHSAALTQEDLDRARGKATPRRGANGTGRGRGQNLRRPAGQAPHNRPAGQAQHSRPAGQAPPNRPAGQRPRMGAAVRAARRAGNSLRAAYL